MERELLLDKYFKDKKRTPTMGMEVEMYLYDAESECLLSNDEDGKQILDECLAELPNTVTKDWYNYQLEVRTMPHDNPETLIKEFQETLLLCRKVFAKRGIEIKPLSWLGGGENYNGVHFHFRNGRNNNYQNTMFNMYPFVLALTDCFKNSVDTCNVVSKRIAHSPHIGFPQLKRLSRRLVGEDRFKDIIVNGYVDNDRHRLKHEPTIEVRTFDVPYNFEYLKNLIRLMYNLFCHINSDAEIKDKTDEEIEQLLYSTREDIMFQRSGLNFLFEMQNTEIYKYLYEKFNIEKLEVPAVLNKENPIKRQSDLRTNWRKLGTKVWLSEEKLVIDKPKPRVIPSPPPRVPIYQPRDDEEEMIEGEN
jgi:hypothetical protein